MCGIVLYKYLKISKTAAVAAVFIAFLIYYLFTDILVLPPMYFLKGSGMYTLPSSCK